MNKNIIDISVGTGAITTPAWVTTVTGVGELVIVTLGIVLVTIRLLIALRDYRDRNSKD
tara:strand:- start:8340 stop:8516 length:177 start_codon:yes stop_codon:yes gene_type:complete